MLDWVLVSPSVAASDTAATVNGNSRTAERWAQLLHGLGRRVEVLGEWTPGSPNARAMMALHARRSAASIAAWASAHPTKPLAVVLTGTDVYRDIHNDLAAQTSLQLATHLVVLQDLALLELPEGLRAKAHVVVQSANMHGLVRTRSVDASRLQVLMVGHLRDEKDPLTYMQAARLLRETPGIQLLHIGDGLDSALHADALRTQADCPNYRYLGAMPYAQTLQNIANADLLVHASRMEGGAHVIAEACCAGVPVLASRISGNVGMLGQGYGDNGYFDMGDAHQLTERLRMLHASPEQLALLARQCRERSALFTPEREQASLALLSQHIFKQP